MAKENKALIIILIILLVAVVLFVTFQKSKTETYGHNVCLGYGLNEDCQEPTDNKTNK